MKWVIQTFLVILFLTCPAKKAEAVSVSEVDTTVRIGVCGDGVAEGPEDCDGSDLGTGSCLNEGFAAGTLSCDASCEYVTSACSGTAISPSPTPSPSPLSSSTTTATSNEDESEIVETVVTATTQAVEVVENVIQAIQNTLEVIPEVVTSFDTDGDERISTDELPLVLSVWVRSWRGYVAELIESGEAAEESTADEGQSSAILAATDCDLNADSQCNLVDLSIMFYYVDK